MRAHNPGNVGTMRGALRLARRIGVTVAGTAVLATGLVLLIAPGPGFLVIALGLGILSTEFAWAQRRVEAARRTATELADKAAANVVSTVFAVLFGVGMVAAGAVWISVRRLPASGPWTGGSAIFSGLVILATIVASLRQAHRTRTAPEPAGSGECRADGTGRPT